MGEKRCTFEGINGVMILSHKEQPKGKTEGMLHYIYDKAFFKMENHNPKDYRACFCRAISLFNGLESLHCGYGRYPEERLHISLRYREMVCCTYGTHPYEELHVCG